MKHFIIIALCLSFSFSMLGQDYVNPSYRRGFATEAEAGYVKEGAYANFSLGYNITHGLFAGLGAGAERRLFDSPVQYHTIAPAFVQVRYSFIDKIVSPFIEMKAGILADYTDDRSGYFLRPAIGVEYRHLGLKLGYDWSELDYGDISFSDHACTIGVFYRF